MSELRTRQESTTPKTFPMVSIQERNPFDGLKLVPVETKISLCPERKDLSLSLLDIVKQYGIDVQWIPLDIEESSYSQSTSENHVSIKIQKDLRKYVVSSLVPDIMKYLEEKMPTIDGYPSKYFPFEKLVYHTGSLLPAFDRQQQYDLTEMEDILTLPRQVFSKLLAKTSVGAAIRISKVIGKENHAEAINKIVRDSFTPEEHPDLNDKYRIAFCAEEEFA